MTSTKRRSPGEGSVFESTTSKGAPRFGIEFTRTLDDGGKKQVLRRRNADNQPWTTKRAAQSALREAMAEASRPGYVEPSKLTFGEYLDTWSAGLRLAPSTTSSYEKNIRLHIKPNLGALPLAKVTGTKLSALYRTLEKEGRKDHRSGDGLSARSVRYAHTIVHKALESAVTDGLLSLNPDDRANPPTSKQAKAPEMRPWTSEHLRTFLAWSTDHSPLHIAWYVLAMTGMRRGEALALRWRDVDLDDDTVALLRSYRRERGALALQFGRDDALVFADHEGAHLHPERFSRKFKAEVRRCQKQLGKLGVDDAPAEIRLHDLRHTHATVLLGLGTNPKVVSERLAHSSISVTMDTYSHVLPTIQRQAVDQLHAMMSGA